MTTTHETTVRTLRQWRLLRGYTHKGLAAASGLALSTVQAAERDDWNPEPRTVAALARGLVVEPEQITEVRRALRLDGEVDR